VREQDNVQRNALQSVVKQAAIRQFRVGSASAVSGQDWEDLGVTIAGRSTVYPMLVRRSVVGEWD
jgi:hypothetical protein